MKVTYNWLKDFVEIKILPQTLADKLTMAGLEVTSLEKKGSDFIFEIEVTSNRPDLLSVIGIAREVAAITNLKLRLPQTTGFKFQAKSLQPAACSLQPISIKIENKKDCPLYTAKIIRDVKVGPSPDWLKKRLELIGCRSTNNIVDITNYVLFEWGEPLHAFDLDKLNSDTIVVRRARDNEKIIAIDGQERILSPEVLVIANKERPQAVAGIMGGKDTEVTKSTKNVLLEAAIFNPIIIRRARQKLGLQTDSSYRFERGIDLETVESASWRVTQLIQEIAQGRCILAKSSRLFKVNKRNITLDVSCVSKILGVNINAPKIKKILNSLGFKTKSKTRNNFTVRVPSHRPDVNLEIDLIEEIARIFGYTSIPKSLPRVLPQVEVGNSRDLPRLSLKYNIELGGERGLVSLVKNILVGLGLNEVITYSLINRDLLEGLESGKDNFIEILNPLSKEQEILRPTIIPGLLKSVAYNLNQKQNYINIFEIANAFSAANESTPKEELVLGIALCGTKQWLSEQGQIKEEVGLLHLKGILEVLFKRLGIEDYNFAMDSANQVSVLVGKEKIGAMARLPKNILDNFDIKNKGVFVTELSLARFFSYVKPTKKFVPLSKYPGIARDISFILKEDISIKEIFKAIQEKARPLLSNIKIIDYYKGKQIPSGFKGLTISCLYRSDERTLTETEINPLHILICSILEERFGAKIRQ